MRWRDILIGAIITLGITVIGGVIVYYVTRQPPAQSPAERLVYEVTQPTVFETQSTRLSLGSVRVGNVGNAPAKDVRVVIDFGAETSVVDKKIGLSSGLVGSYEDRSTEKSRLDIYLPVLAAGETLAVSAMLNGILRAEPEVGVRSAMSIGERGSFVRQVGEEPKRDPAIQGVLSALIPLLALAQVPLFFIVTRRLRSRFQRLVPGLKSVNNTAFLYIHKGLYAEAEALLAREISRQGAGVIELANYALALGLNGDVDGAEKRLAAAEWWAGPKSERALVAFNRGLLSLANRDPQAGAKHLRIALDLSHAEIASYCNLSEVLRVAMGDFPEIKELVQNEALATTRASVG